MVHGGSASAEVEMLGARNVFHEWWFWICSSTVLMLKFLVVPMYHSTDFEVHRNWMAITYNLPINEWYYESTSEWTLDYPPLFAFFEFLLSQIAKVVVPSALSIQKEPFISPELLYFHRFSVIACDVLYIISCGFLTNTLQLVRICGDKSRRCAMGGCILLLANISLILVDNIHFQYNGILTAILLFSINFAIRGQFLLAAFLYCLLLNMKHIYAYYATAYFIFYLCEYIFISVDRFIIIRTIKLAIAMWIPFILSFGPFLYVGGGKMFAQILSRLFPFQRGLTHAYWAPNIWSLYNLVDLILYRILKVLGRLPSGTQPPQYTSGLVQEYSHCILPSVGALTALGVTLVLLSPMIAALFMKHQRNCILLLTHSAFAFFLAGYHVHEKAILLVTVPYTILSATDHRFLSSFVVLSAIANVSLFPLFFSPFENMIKVSLTLCYHFLSECIVKFICMENSSKNCWQKFYLYGVFFIQFYCLILHRVLFGSRFEYLPLMLTSVSTAVGIVVIFVELLVKGYSKELSYCRCQRSKEKLKVS
ncbi:putative dolichyl pyrophosphate Glc1Man9GlcNAc2 alpha-1,3-glucosyltransferase [Toxocara canis]|uniref:Alpha-1,3-glucosyltransferase n=1 Tax=Toxocara canis TaxID=6265 RepID=A0A0B2VD22_TOXCA|nr:putative dolichyl pyrophosphate Glc1Man9GlcNAc2 alpha-1,3-glucosyltransferase [Toxocara canis]